MADPIEEAERDIVDESSEQSFPASDPPAWTLTVGPGAPAHRVDKQPSAESPETVEKSHVPP